MKEISKIFESLYGDFLLRDLFAKIVPGFVVLATVFCLHDADRFEKVIVLFNWAAILLAAGVCWILGFGIQQLGELTKLLKHHPKSFDDSKKRYGLRTEFDRFASDKEKKQTERYAVIKESTGNLATALLVVIVMLVANRLYEVISDPIYAPDIKIDEIAVLMLFGATDYLLWRASRSHAKKHYVFMETAHELRKDAGRQLTTSAAIFNFDGIILDTMPKQESLWRSAASKIDDTQTKRLLENFRRGKVGAQIFENLSISTIVQHELLEQYNRDWLENRAKVQLVWGAVEALRELEPRMVLAIASSAPRDYILDHLNKNGLGDLFSTVVTDKEVNRAKPDPEMLYRIAGKTGVPASRTIMIGDSWDDAKMAEQAGMEFILFQHANRTDIVPNLKPVTAWKDLKNRILRWLPSE